MTSPLTAQQIIPAREKDIPVLQYLCRQTFLETFTDTNTAQDMQEYLDKNFNATQLLREMEQPSSHFFIAFWDAVPAAYLRINEPSAHTEAGYPDALEIHRLYVLKAHKGRRIGRTLMEHALQFARQKQLKSAWLGVWEHNEPALRFYRKMGFEVTGKHTFVLGQDRQTDLIMTRPLADTDDHGTF